MNKKSNESKQLAIEEEGKKKVTYDYFDRGINELDQRLTDKIYEIRDQVTANYISVLGIFASIVAFLLIEVQILRNVCAFNRIVGFTLIFFGLILTFVLSLNLFTQTQEQTKRFWYKFFSVVLIVILISGLGYLLISRAEDEYTCKIKNLDSEFEKMKSDIENKEFERYRELEKQIQELKKSPK